VDKAQTLEASIETMQARIENLERELAELDLHSDASSIKAERESPLGIAAVGVNGVVNHVGSTAASEFLTPLLPVSKMVPVMISLNRVSSGCATKKVHRITPTKFLSRAPGPPARDFPAR
jgi:hypothetical protein